MGTLWSARLQLPRGHPLRRVENAVTACFQEVIRQMSHWDPESELGRFNSSPAGSWHRLSPEFFTVLSRALEIARLTDGALDPTLGEIVDLHGHGPSRACDLTRLPEARQLAGWRRLELDASSGSAFQPGGLRLDLSSIAKGFAVDFAADRLLELGVRHFLLEIGGELRGHGCKPDGEPWWAAIERASPDFPETIAALCSHSLATSGTRFRDHLIDPQTALPAAGGLVSVSVLAPLCMDADAWATALFILGSDNGMEMADRHGLAAMFVVRHEERFSERPSRALLAMEE